MLAANPVIIYLDATSLVTFSGIANAVVLWSVDYGTIEPFRSYTDETGHVSALFTPSEEGVSTVTVTHAV